jgi:hypothetical protein
VNTTASETSDRLAWTRRLQVLLGAESVLLVLASVNRLWDATDAEVLPHGSLRVVDVVNLMVLAPASALVLYLLLEHVLGDLPRRPDRDRCDQTRMTRPEACPRLRVRDGHAHFRLACLGGPQGAPYGE